MCEAALGMGLVQLSLLCHVIVLYVNGASRG
jgi:hypothetical protein